MLKHYKPLIVRATKHQIIIHQYLFRHGEPWKKFRTRVQKPVLQPQIVRKYITPIEIVTSDFIKRYYLKLLKNTSVFKKYHVKKENLVLSISNIYVCRIEDIQQENGELPGDFDNEIHKWALECKCYLYKIFV